MLLLWFDLLEADIQVDFLFIGGLFVVVGFMLKESAFQVLKADGSILKQRIALGVHRFSHIESEVCYQEHQHDHGQKHIISDEWINKQMLLCHYFYIF
jgi:hypothetical protein